MYQCSKRLVKYKDYSCFDDSDFPAHSVFTFDVCWGSLCTNVFGNPSSAVYNTRLRLLSRVSFRFLWLCLVKTIYINKTFSLTNFYSLKIQALTHWYIYPFEVPLITLVIASTASLWTLSILSDKLELLGWSKITSP